MNMNTYINSDHIAFMVALITIVVVLLIVHLCTSYRKCKSCGTIFKKHNSFKASNKQATKVLIHNGTYYELCPKCGAKHFVCKLQKH